MIARVITDLELANFIHDLALAADLSLSNQLLAIPVPQEDLPVRLTGKCNDKAVIFVIEGAGDELTRVVSIHVLDVLGHRFLFLCVGKVIDSELAFVSYSTALAHSKPFLFFVDRDVGDCLRVRRSYTFRKVC